ncbi:MAG: hypothetical protein A2908_00110 [Candidatus Staskawiczbacteria bacterium RIFCSPLOWO2_01_FULL_38_12b]|uniref:Peptidoglycan binding-like domain-containing protein n=1 Tax=Candidatus Staskawiczbacteria bacterium RIFCSPLOWO2_01_FULL_38_12b TaxID=1802214 RepID=A0A1G2IFN8_9BACT|nr:MAG: hypothetical protein A2908_00110 [Candidatus Staskawiczbacteria bacterium RIFCSPLOWO2_01_FULL_38_12b]
MKNFLPITLISIGESRKKSKTKLKKSTNKMLKHIISGYKIMNKTISLKKVEYGYVLFFAAALLLLAGMILMAKPVGAATFNSINSRLGVGSSGSNVTNLQTFLASDHNIYPEGRITGYYGGLTRAAVMQFQVNYGISMVGVVGPITLAKMNNVINAGYGIDVYAPSIYNISVQKTNNSATFNWATTESARGKVYYSTSPFAVSEAVGNFSAPFITGGSTMMAAFSQLNQNVSVNNLQSNTTYYYIIEVIDASGNVAVTVQSTFATN